MAQDFATPDRRSPPESILEEKKNLSTEEAARDTSKMVKAATVTPPESMTREDGTLKKVKKDFVASPMQIMAGQVESPDDRHVRFDKEDETPLDSPSSSNSQRGLVSRRGGRCSSPGRIVGKASVKKESVLEFKAYRSPQRKKDENDTVPSLCSANSLEKDKDTSEETGTKIKEEDRGTSATGEKDRKPESISCDSAMDQTSPIASDQSHDNTKTPKAKVEDTREEKVAARKSNATKTGAKSPTGEFQNLPTLDDDALRSPGAFFLSPHPPTPSYRDQAGSLVEADKTSKKSKSGHAAEIKENIKSSPKTPKSPRTPKRDLERERFVTTPTNFATDYGKHPNSASFDSSNVLAWLQSPTSNGLFSPGGFGSLLGTPRGGITPRGVLGPRTPRTPTVSTSFFFSDVAGLPRSGDLLSPKQGAEAGKRGRSSHGYSNIICISPLASSKVKNGASMQGHTPTINYKDMFASPAERRRGLSLLGESPLKGMKPRGVHGSTSKDPSLDAVHMAERDLMEDEDLSVLLQLASNTPKATGDRPVAVSTSDGTHVFRSPNGRNKGRSGDDNLPSLQLPIIGGRDSGGNGTRLSRKTHSRDHDEADEFHRPLSMRSTSRDGKDYHGNSNKSGGKGSVDKRKDNSKKDGSKKAGQVGMLNHPGAPPYGMPPHHYPHPDAAYYPPIAPGMPPHGGSMRVVVNAPPPSRKKSSGSPHGPSSPPGSRPYRIGPGDPKYPPPPYPPPPGHYPHHPGVPPPHMHPHYSHYPPHHHPPHRPHMSMYGPQHPSSKTKPPKKLTKTKAGTKRSSPGPGAKVSAKKSKKSPSGTPKKKNKSPQLTDKAERQKAAATIQKVNAASGGKNDKAAALAAAILRGVTMRPSGKWQAQLYFAGKSRYIGVFDTREKAALAYEIAREKLKSEKSNAEGGTLSAKATENAVNAARKAAFDGVNERDPRLSSK